MLSHLTKVGPDQASGRGRHASTAVQVKIVGLNLQLKLAVLILWWISVCFAVPPESSKKGIIRANSCQDRSGYIDPYSDL